MSAEKQGISMMGMGYLPMEPAWLVESDAFHHADSRIVRAAYLMLFSAWQSRPAGSVGSSFKAISRVCHLTEEEVGDHYEALTKGWELRGDRLCHIGMSELCERLNRKFGLEIEQIALRSAVVTQDPENFELVSPEPEGKRLGKRKFPAELGITSEVRQHMIAEGFVTEQDQEWIFKQHKLWATSTGEMRSNWEASLMHYISREPKHKIPSRSAVETSGQVTRSRSNRFGLAGPVTHSHNQTAMQAARCAGQGMHHG